ncbi:retrovirus-related pol polyprotein from transposon TNT 1-94 [Tanacetum coccineum]
MNSNKYLEGLSMQRPPLFESDSFIYWKNRFETYVKSKDLDLWHVITNGDFQLIIQNSETKLDEKALLITHQGNSQVKDNKIDILVQQYEQFVISKDESIDSAFARFNTIITSLKALDEGYSSKNYVRKFLRALHPKWREKVMAIEESKDLTSLSLDELIGNLKVHEIIIKKDSEIVKAKVEKKTLALKAKKESSDEECLTSESEDEEYAMAVRDFKKFFKRRGRFRSKSSYWRMSKATERQEPKSICWRFLEDSVRADEKDHDETCLVAQAPNEKLSTLEKNKGVDIDCAKCHTLKIENEKLKEESTRLNKFEKSTHCLNEMLNNQKPSGDKLGLGFNSFEASSSGTKEIKFVKAQKKTSSDGGPINMGGPLNVQAAPKINMGPPPATPGSEKNMPWSRLGADEWIKDSGCSKHMTGNQKLFSTYKAYNRGNVIFGSNLRGNIIGKASKELVRNLPKLKFDQHFCNACKIGKQAYVSHKAKNIVSTTRCLELINMDIFGPSTIRSYGGNRYTLVIVDDYSREFDNEVQFGEFCNANGITHNFSAPRTPQSNGVVERKNRTLQEMSRTMLNEQSLPQKFWCNVIDTSTYILNRILIRAILGKTPYEILRGRKPTLDYFRVFGSKCFILNTKDYLTKFDPKSYEGVFLGYSQNSKAYIILNKHTRKIEESLNVTFDETPPPSKTSPLVDDDLDEEEAIREIKKKNLENVVEDETLEIDDIVNIKESRNHPLENVIGNLNQRTLRSQAQNQSNFFCFISTIEPKNVNEALGDESWIVAMQEELNQLIANNVWELVPQPKNMIIIGTKWVFRNKLDENGVVSQNKAKKASRLQQQEALIMMTSYASVARLGSIRILLAYAYVLKF